VSLPSHPGPLGPCPCPEDTQPGAVRAGGSMSLSPPWEPTALRRERGCLASAKITWPQQSHPHVSISQDVWFPTGASFSHGLPKTGPWTVQDARNGRRLSKCPAVPYCPHHLQCSVAGSDMTLTFYQPGRALTGTTGSAIQEPGCMDNTGKSMFTVLEA
jgi:hypothetical protein